MRAKAAFFNPGRDQGQHRKPKTEKRLCGQARDTTATAPRYTAKNREISAKLSKNLWLR